MFFYMPTKVYSENNCVRAHAKELASIGKKALIVTGRNSAFKNGSAADVETALSEYGVEWAFFNEIEENPSVETVMKGRDRGLAEGVDFVIGIGGGSPMDAAKAIALMIRCKDAGDVRHRFGSDRCLCADPALSQGKRIHSSQDFSCSLSSGWKISHECTPQGHHGYLDRCSLTYV